MSFPVISADSHITEPPDTYVDHIDPKWKARAPQMKYVEKLGDVFVVDGLERPIPMGLVAAAGKPPEEIRMTVSRFSRRFVAQVTPLFLLAHLVTGNSDDW